jgi:hypothetical protein
MVWPADIRADVVDRVSRPGLGRWLAQVQQVRQCAHPVRLRGRNETIDLTTGEILVEYDTAREPDGIAYMRCGNRRAAMCPSCSHEYQGDVWHLIMAGAAGGMKNVPASIIEHPLVFATLTAPSYGAVHTAKKPGRPGNRRCHPRIGRGRKMCPHGRPTWCMAVHEQSHPAVGQPLCAECYD